MAYDKTLFTHPNIALDAGIIYDQNESKMQDEINSEIFEEFDNKISTPADPNDNDVLSYDNGEWVSKNIASTNLPLVDGIASSGNSDLLAREDHIHPVDTSRAAESDHKIKTYNSPADLGLTKTEATIINVWDAMEDNTILIANADLFNSSSVPNNLGVVEILKLVSTSGIGNIKFYGKTSVASNYKMYFNNSNKPTGTWLNNDISSAIFDTKKFTASIALAAHTGDHVDFGSIARTGYTPIGIAGFDVTGKASGNWACARTAYLKDATTADMVIVNTSGTDYTWTAMIYVLYIKN